MIVILTSETDSTSHDVIDWLFYIGNKYFVLNENTNVNFTYANINNREIIFKNKRGITNELSLKEVKSFWYRRYALNIGIKTENSSGLYPNYYNHIVKENNYIRNYINYILENKKSIGKELDNFLSKLEQLDKAQEIGLLIPPTYIVSTKKSLIDVFLKEKSLITKSIQYPIQFFFKDGVSHYAMTELINEDFVKNNVSQFFLPTLIQKNIEKKYELRIFFLHNKFYSMAIFSQNNKCSKTDWRVIDDNDKPNRIAPYKLPKAIKNKLVLLMKSINLNSGSIDMIVTLKQEYYFLEVNPIGQFSQLSYMCNYFLEEEIAKFLSNN